MSYQGPGLYQHYKGGNYEVLGLGVREETIIKPGEDPLGDAFREGLGETPEPVIVVVYRPLTPGSMLGHGELRGVSFWTRNLDVFNETVISGSLSMPRFAWVRDLLP